MPTRMQRQRKTGKLSTPFHPRPLVVTSRKGSMVTARRLDGSLVTRNTSMFHRLPYEVAEYHPMVDDDDKKRQRWPYTQSQKTYTAYARTSEHESSINNILVVHERHLVLSSETNGVIKLWQAEDGETCMTLFGPVQWLCIAPNSQFAVSGSGAQSLKLWRVDTGDICQSVNHADRITCVTFSGDSQYLVTGSADKSLKVWEAATGKLTQVLVEHTACVSCVAVSDSNRHVISGSHDTNLLVWGLSTGAVEHQLTGHTDHVTCVKITSDGTTALSGSRDGCLHIWNMTYGLPVTIFDMHLAVLNVEMTPDAAHIVVQLERSQHVPLMCLHNSPAGEVKSQSQIEIQVLGGGPVLPIKAKPLTASHPTARFMTSKLQKFTDLYPSVSSIPEIVKTPLQKAVKAQEQNKETRGQRSMFGSLRPRNSSKKTQHASKSGVCTLL
ncbi:hypothetical protein LSAT2_020126 [Lamellibrachia satsuma]|nr:hypothetical protein LSAT2_020126 [Lamellibrachia satsuma]